MALRSPNKDWPEELKKIYHNQFLPDCKSGRFVVPNSMFSNSGVLECLENEVSSAQAIAKLVKNLSGGKINSILIVGSGSGRLGIQVRELLPEVNLLEIDKNRLVVERLQHRYSNDIRRKSYCADVCNMPFGDGSIDLVICYSVFRYIGNLDKAVSELIRVTRGNGRVIIAEAKDFDTIERIKGILKGKDIGFKRKTIPSVRLPHLTFYYYLLTQYSKDRVITEFIEGKKVSGNVDRFQAAFELAGSSIGTIYALVFKKSI